MIENKYNSVEYNKYNCETFISTHFIGKSEGEKFIL